MPQMLSQQDLVLMHHAWVASRPAKWSLGCAGRLARAYLDGYNCTDETELQQLCGGQL